MVDLHTHSYFSDGYSSPSDVVNNAYNKGVRCLALTDHDTTEGIDEFLKTAETHPDLKPIIGCELSANFNDVNTEKEVHVLALGIKNLPTFNSFVKKTADIRKDGVLKRVELLQNKGFDITKDEVLAINVGTLTNVEIVKAMKKKGLIKTKDDLSDTLNPDSKSPFKKGGYAYYNIYNLFPDISEVIKNINESGAFSVLAHPYRLCLSDNDLLIYIKKLKDYGLCGIECYHSNHSLEETDFYLKIAKDLDLIVTGGSDHHAKEEQKQKEYGMSNKLQMRIPLDIANIFNKENS
jgi:predicted metal-dependent phosphoesterase TrpH